MVFVQPQLRRNGSGGLLGVAGEQDGFGDARPLQALDGGLCPGLHLVRDADAAGIRAVHRHVDGGACGVALRYRDVLPIHQAQVARRHSPALNPGQDAVAADLLNVGDRGLVQGF